MDLESFLRVVEAAAVVVAASSGIVEARRKDVDLVGGYVAAFLTAFGGSTLRDLLLDRRPFFWVAAPAYPVVILGLSIVAFYAPRVLAPLQGRRARKAGTALDAVALGLYGALGTLFALDAGMPGFVAILLGVVSGSFGGVLRDVVINEVPFLFRQAGHLYATAAFAGGAVLVLAAELGAPRELALEIAAAVTVGIRWASIRFDLKLPRPRV